MMKMVKLEDICQINMGKTPSRDEPKYWRGNHTWVAIADLKGDVLISKTKEGITDLALKECGIKPVSKGTLLYSFKLSIGKVAITDKELYTNEAIVALPIKDSKQVDLKYLYYAIQQVDLTGIGDKAVKGITLNKEKLKRLEIPLPTLEKQQQIAHILDKADALRRKDRELLQQYDALAQAIFIEMFGDPVRNERGWKVGTIREMASEVKYGTSSPAESQGDYVYLRMNNITYGGEWDFKDLKYISVSSENKPKYVLKKHDLVFNRTNSKELVGKTAVYDQEQEMIIAGYLIRVRTNAYGNPYYISGFLNSKIGKSILFNMCKSIIGMANINAQELQNIQLQIPPIELQNEYQLRIEAIKGLKQNVLAAQQQSETLFQSLLQGAFSGRL
jgi:type I restriction enzyme, S subunit